MHVSPSGLSRQIQKLEQSIKQPLFLRDNRSVELTAAGKKLLPVAVKIMAQWQEYKHEIDVTSSELQGELRLFCSVTACYSHLSEILTAFRLLYPSIEIKLSTGDPAQAIEKVINGSVDIAISAKPSQLSAKIAFRTIDDVSLSIISPKEISFFSDTLRSENPDWANLPFILPETGIARERANSWFKKMKINPNIYTQVSGHEAIVCMVALGFGVGIVPDVVINNSPVREKIARFTPAYIKPFELGICCQQAQLNDPLIKALWTMMENNASHQ